MLLHETGDMPFDNGDGVADPGNDTGVLRAMKTVNLVQGSAPWHEFRSRHFPASQSGSMLDINPHHSRNDLLFERKTGISKPFPEFLSKRGHASEASARPIAEKMIETELFPATGYDEKTLLSASFDGLSLDGTTIWEHKQWNKDIAATMRESNKIPKYYMAQVQQQLFVSGADRCLFMCSDGTPDNLVGIWIYPDEDWGKVLLSGWKDFEADLKLYDPEANKPKWAEAKADVADAPQEFLEKEELLASLMDEQDELSVKIKDLTAELKVAANGKEIQGRRFKVSTSERKGSVAWEKACKAFAPEDFDPELYRGKSTQVTTLRRIEK